jgi:hypothetical protein
VSSNVTRLVPGGSSVTRAAPDGATVTTASPGGATVTRAAPSGPTVTRLSPPAPARGGGESDAFADAVNAVETLGAWWSVVGAEAGDLADDAVAMRQVGEDDNPNLIAALASTGNWRVVDDNIGDTATLRGALESIQSDASNFVGIEAGATQSSALAECLTRSTGVKSGFAFFKNAGANWGSANYGNIFQFDGDSSSTSADLASHEALGFFKGTASLGKIRMSVPQELGLNGASFMAVDAWYFIGWRQTSEGNFTIHTARVGVAWSSRQEISGASDHSHDGLTLGLAMKNSGPQQWDGWRWGPIGFFTADIGDSGLEAIFEAIG